MSALDPRRLKYTPKMLIKYSNTTRALLTHGDSPRETVKNRSHRGGQRSQPEDCRDEQAPDPTSLLRLPEAGIATFAKHVT